MIFFLRTKGSPFADSLARVADGALVVLDLGACEADEPVTVEGGRVLWQGAELTSARAVIVEELGFAWPQRLGGPRAPADDRPRRALALSALAATAERVPTVDAPEAAHLAALPLQALQLVAARGIPVQPHRLEPASPTGARGPARLRLDPLGAVRGYVPRSPADDEPAWSPEPFAGEVLRVLVVGGAAVGALCSADGESWAAGRHEGRLPADELAPAERDLAEAAAGALACHAVEVSLVRASGAVLGCRPGPDWSRFEAALGPRVPRALWEHALRLEPR